MNHKRIQWSLTVTAPQGTEFFSVTGGFRLMQVLEIKTAKTPDPSGCKYFRCNHYIQVFVSDSFQSLQFAVFAKH
jgi:hypothetical protein